MTRKVLVVEDYADLRLAIGDALTRGHYECECVGSNDAIGRLSREHYAAILLAPQLPISDDRIILFLRENQPEEMRKVILMTDPDVTAPAYRLLIKPFNKEQLMRQLRRD